VIPSRWALAFVAGAALVLAACSSSPSAPPQKHASSNNHPAVTTTSSTTTSTTAPSTTSTTVAPATCTHVTASPAQGQAAAGTITGMVNVTNAGSAPCTVDGYPTMGLFSGSGAPLTVTMTNGLSVTVSSAANAAPSSFSLAPSASAQFVYQYSDVPVGTQTSCPSSETADVTMPGASTASPTFQLAIAPCANGTIRVSPVYASS